MGLFQKIIRESQPRLPEVQEKLTIFHHGVR